MFLATIVRRDQDQLLNLIEDKTVYYLPGKDHLMVVAVPSNIPLSLREEMVPLIYNTGFVSPVRAFQNLEYLQTNIQPDAGTLNSDTLEYQSDPEVNRKLMAIRSQLAYVASELWGPDRFYFKLELPRNEVGTQREYLYRLYFGEISCFYLKTDPLIDTIHQLLPKEELGPLICSSYALNLAKYQVPKWYLKETFRDLCNLEELDMTEKVLITGEKTGELYLFYENVVNVTEEQMDALIEQINNIINSSIMARIFPRQTPERFRQTRQLRSMQNGQWTLDLPLDSNLFQNQIEIAFTLPQVEDLFWFLSWLMLAPTYPFIEKELKIEVHPHQIEIRYFTEYYPDYLRVITASHARGSGKEEAMLYYSERLSPKQIEAALRGGPQVSFYDQENHQKAIIVAENEIMPKFKLERSTPVDYSLESRLKQDYEITTILSIS